MGKKNLIIAIVILAVAVIALIIALLFALRGFSPAAQATPTTDSNVVLTAAADTANARLTELVLSTPSVTPEPPTATVDPAQTAAAQTLEAQLTQQALVTLTPAASATATLAPTSSLADKAVYVSDVTIPDGTDMEPDEDFTKTWRIQNIGTTTWTTSYKLVFISGDKMGDVTSVALQGNVAPNETVDVSVELVAPGEAGKYRGYWKMINAAGEYFNDSIYVEIDVVTGDGATAEPSSTPADGSGDDVITDLSIAVDNAQYTGSCPHLFTFSATFTVLEAATLTYGLEAGADNPNFDFNLPEPQTAAFSPGTYTLSFPLEFDSSVDGWVRLHITSPVDITSDKVQFALDCE
ncbi:MAG: hypothetical protein JW726_03535 [Anaerolineales bacterium]|nr:hypothetical protein [Anaerolineales bacterium]